MIEEKIIDAFPLAWPLGWERIKNRQKSRFNIKFGKARNILLNELNLLGAKNVIISSNIPLRNDGLPYALTSQPIDCGIVAYFYLNGNHQCIPCDKWNRTQDNLWAICKTVNALRGLDRWGAKEMVNAAFRGFKALPEARSNWKKILKLGSTPTEEEIKNSYKKLCKIYHPDMGGSAEKFVELSNAYKEALKGGE